MARISWLQSSLFHLQRDRLHGAGSDKGTMPDLVGFDQRNQYIQLLRTQADTQSRAFRKGLCTVATVHPMRFTAMAPLHPGIPLAQRPPLGAQPHGFFHAAGSTSRRSPLSPDNAFNNGFFPGKHMVYALAGVRRHAEKFYVVRGNSCPSSRSSACSGMATQSGRLSIS